MDLGLYRKVMARVVAPLTVGIILSSLDRVNVSFAALHMNADIGLDPKAYGFGVGIFFVGYLLFQLPSAEVLKRIGPAPLDRGERDRLGPRGDGDGGDPDAAAFLRPALPARRVRKRLCAGSRMVRQPVAAAEISRAGDRRNAARHPDFGDRRRPACAAR